MKRARNRITRKKILRISSRYMQTVFAYQEKTRGTGFTPSGARNRALMGVLFDWKPGRTGRIINGAKLVFAPGARYVTLISRRRRVVHHALFSMAGFGHRRRSSLRDERNFSTFLYEHYAALRVGAFFSATAYAEYCT